MVGADGLAPSLCVAHIRVPFVRLPEVTHNVATHKP